MSKSKYSQPRWVHDCPNCQYLGSSEKGVYDYYTCPQRGMRTYIARYGDEPWEYSSMPVDHVLGGFDGIPDDDPIKEAYRRYKSGLYNN